MKQKIDQPHDLEKGVHIGDDSSLSMPGVLKSGGWRGAEILVCKLENKVL